MSIDKIIQSIRNNKQNHLVDFRLKSKTEDFTDDLFHILFDSKISVSENIDDLANSFNDIALMIDNSGGLGVENIWKKFLIGLPELLNQLNQDAKCIYLHDPAARSVEEVILAYPGFYAIAVYRISHNLHNLQMPLVPRMMSEYAHRHTGIDIHPGAVIGSPFFIDHGTGVVIGESTIIKNSVKLYQGVTLGALQVSKEMENTKRHPTVENNVTIYAGATILGGDTIIGENCTIGGNVWLTQSVPANSIVYQRTDTKLKQKTDHAD
ncbi:serine O-acetyltransferase [Lutimonas halocynthiae]|uniref:serine O-acetyltransferase EpsC n=1 Tax=Lutimonas halocynthiae TaxID=1446477 RepID=UPI0025B5D158|nr:serine O-acetyltransferase EpsC [Lutimonas halocynthiae]MDN3642561.1 serine O-acetyltransferase [Lutimonas halocynthiae]